MLGILWGIVCLSWLIRIFFPSAVPFSFLHPSDQIADIQTARITEDISLYEHSTSESLSILHDKTFTISRIRPENRDEFLALFSSVPCYQWVNDPHPYLRGKAILITYEDGSMEWICADGTFYRDSTANQSGMTWYYFDKEAFSGMLSACSDLS